MADIDIEPEARCPPAPGVYYRAYKHDAETYCKLMKYRWSAMTMKSLSLSGIETPIRGCKGTWKACRRRETNMQIPIKHEEEDYGIT